MAYPVVGVHVILKEGVGLAGEQVIDVLHCDTRGAEC